jgi:hypothetical protein
MIAFPFKKIAQSLHFSLLFIMLAHLAVLAILTLQATAKQVPPAGLPLQWLVGDTNAFFQHVYKQDVWHAKRDSTVLDTVFPIDSWLSELTKPDLFLTAVWPAIVNADDDQIATFKTNSGLSLPISSCNSSVWEDCKDEFHSNGRSAVVRRQYFQLPLTDLEDELLSTFHLPSITAHAYISAGSAQALKPHTDS